MNSVLQMEKINELMQDLFVKLCVEINKVVF